MNKNHKVLIVLALSLSVFFLANTVFADPLAVADRLDNTIYKGWTYGPDQSKQQINCSQFVVAVVEAELEVNLERKYKNAINIHPAPPDLNKAIEDNLGLMRGVHYALIDLLEIGEHVEPEKAQPGDFIQYWKKNEAGDWRGHSAIISKVWDDSNGNKRAEIMGAHEPKPKTKDFLARKDFDGAGLNLQEPGRLVYIVRLKK
jgi:hypothetical protein